MDFQIGAAEQKRHEIAWLVGTRLMFSSSGISRQALPWVDESHDVTRFHRMIIFKSIDGHSYAVAEGINQKSPAIGA